MGWFDCKNDPSPFLLTPSSEEWESGMVSPFLSSGLSLTLTCQSMTDSLLQAFIFSTVMPLVVLYPTPHGSQWIKQRGVLRWSCAVFSHSIMSNYLWPPLGTVARKAPLSLGILQARIPEWVAMPSSRGSSQPRDQTQVSHIAGRFFTVWATNEAQGIQITV